MYNVIWAKIASKDLGFIIDCIAQDSVQIALKQFHKIKEAAQNLCLFPDQSRIIPELSLQNIFKYRELIIKPWRVMYKIEQKNVYVLAVIDGRRNIENILLNRQLR